MTATRCPLVEPLEPAPEPEQAFLRLSRAAHCLFLDSALRDPRLGRYSFLAADPFAYVELSAEAGDCLGWLAGRLAGCRAETAPGLPPFQGGAAGLFSYDLGRQLERLPRPACDEFALPVLAIGFYDVVIAWDHAQDRAWIISQGLPELDPAKRRQRAEERLRQARARLESPAPDRATSTQDHAPGVLAADQLAPQFPVQRHDGLTSNYSREGFLRAIQRAIDYVFAGDVFQVNLAQRLLFPARDDPVSLYLRLRRRNPAPFAAYFDLGAFQIVSASPERFLCLTGNEVEARPIKGTRRRTSRPDEDAAAAAELVACEKERAENVMIVDLLRNDLSRVCRPDSVRVTQLCEVEKYQYVQHLVSAICGRLREGCGPVDLVKAAFPGGSVTGAPKVRAMEIIAELEPTARGPYCGSLGYVGFDGSMDLSILIRTITAGRGWWQFPVGGGIVAQSDPLREYEETWEKAEGMLRALP